MLGAIPMLLPAVGGRFISTTVSALGTNPAQCSLASDVFLCIRLLHIGLV